MFNLFRGAVTLFILFPIWMCLLYNILVAVNATTLMWFLYFAYAGIVLLTTIFAGIAALFED